MATLVTDPRLEERLKQQRRASGADRYDEVWEGVYMMAPLPNNEHRQMVLRLAMVLEEVVGLGGAGEVYPGVNLAGPGDDWEHDFRVPDLAVFLRGGAAEDCGTHWRGPADFLVEITSPGDQTREKFPFYDRIEVAELLLIDRDPWTLELFRRREGRLTKVGQSCLPFGDMLASQSLGLAFQLIASHPRPRIQVIHPATGRRWLA